MVKMEFALLANPRSSRNDTALAKRHTLHIATRQGKRLDDRLGDVMVMVMAVMVMVTMLVMVMVAMVIDGCDGDGDGTVSAIQDCLF